MPETIHRLAAESALRDSEAKLAFAMEAHGLGLFDWNLATDQVEWSQGGEPGQGLDLGAVTDFESWRDAIVAEDAVPVQQAVAAAVAGRLEKMSFRFRFYAIDGSLRCLEASARCSYDRDGALVRVSGVTIDVTERQNAEQAASDARNELAQVSRFSAMGEMAASLAHELNQPLAATANFLSATSLLVQRGGDRARINEMIGLANEQIQRAGNIIRNIREFIAKREVEIGIEPIEKTIRDSVALVIVGAARIEVDVRYAFDQKSTFMVADRVQIQQVLVNLLRNATEAVHGQPRHMRNILIAVRSVPDDMIEVSVSDTGPGIPANILETIFTPLSSSKGTEGMGLGLSICRRIVEAHGGALTAENRYAGGATFRFTLPAGTSVEGE